MKSPSIPTFGEFMSGRFTKGEDFDLISMAFPLSQSAFRAGINPAPTLLKAAWL
jgi:hypothetical protein